MRTAQIAALVIAIAAMGSFASAQSNAAWLGVSARVVEGDEAKTLGIPGGLKVASVTSGSPAQTAGLEEGDIILSADQDAISTIEGLRKVLEAKKPGDLLNLGVRRSNGRNEPLIVTLGRTPEKDDPWGDDARVKELRNQLEKLDAERRRVAAELEKRLADLRGGKASKVNPVEPQPQPEAPPAEPEQPKPAPEEARTPLAVSLGAALRDLTAEERKNLGLEGGVKVTRVVAQGAAEEAGVKADDVVSKAGGETLTGTGHLRLLLGKLNPGDKLELEVLRDGKKVAIDVTLRPAK